MDRKVISVKRKDNFGAGFIRNLSLVLSILFLLGGIIFNRGLMLPCFLLAALYFFFDACSRKEYEYVIDGNRFTVDEIIGRLLRRTVEDLDLNDLIVLADHDSPAVASIWYLR